MSGPLEIIAAVAVIGYTIARQLIGEPLRGKRVIVLPAVLTVIGILDLRSGSAPVRPADVACLVAGGVLVAAVGVAQARMMRLESRGGGLWGQLPPKGLWLWLLLIASRVLLTLVADAVDAKAAASSSTILLMLGINRLAQAAVIIARGMSSGIPFAPEDDGKSLLGTIMTRPTTSNAEQHEPDRAVGGVDWETLRHQATDHLANKRDNR
jgi:hypothetical protein